MLLRSICLSLVSVVVWGETSQSQVFDNAFGNAPPRTREHGQFVPLNHLHPHAVQVLPPAIPPTPNHSQPAIPAQTGSSNLNGQTLSQPSAPAPPAPTALPAQPILPQPQLGPIHPQQSLPLPHQVSPLSPGNHHPGNVTERHGDNEISHVHVGSPLWKKFEQLVRQAATSESMLRMAKESLHQSRREHAEQMERMRRELAENRERVEQQQREHQREAEEMERKMLALRNQAETIEREFKERRTQTDKDATLTRELEKKLADREQKLKEMAVDSDQWQRSLQDKERQLEHHRATIELLKEENAKLKKAQHESLRKPKRRQSKSKE